MRGQYGAPLNTYGTRLPGAARIARIPVLSKRAKQRLAWMEWYHRHGERARLTCRHFGISPSVFYFPIRHLQIDLGKRVAVGVRGAVLKGARDHPPRSSRTPAEFLLQWKREHPEAPIDLLEGVLHHLNEYTRLTTRGSLCES